MFSTIFGVNPVPEVMEERRRDAGLMTANRRHHRMPLKQETVAYEARNHRRQHASDAGRPCLEQS
jgi:hypothetical protein